MPKPFKYTSVLRLFTKIERDFGITSFNEYDAVEWIGEALELIGAINQYEEAVSFIEVKNHQAVIPSGLVNIIQIAKNNCKNEDSQGICPNDVQEDIRNCSQGLPSVMINSCGIPVSDIDKCPVLIDCHGKPITDYEAAYYRPFFDLQADYLGWTNSDTYKSCFTPVRLSNHTLFNSLVCKLKESEDNRMDSAYKKNHNDEYKVINGELLRFSFRHGQIALSYKRIYLDNETGYPMLPDLVSVTSALGYYIQWKTSSRDFYKGREGANQRMIEAEKQWVWYCRQAGNELTQLYGIDDYQDFLDQMKYLVPQKDRYFGFFGKLNKPENTLQYDNPRAYNLFRGTMGDYDVPDEIVNNIPKSPDCKPKHNNQSSGGNSSNAEKRIIVGVAGITLTDSFFNSNIINKLFTETQVYIVGVNFTQSGGTITAINGLTFYVGQVIIAET